MGIENDIRTNNRYLLLYKVAKQWISSKDTSTSTLPDIYICTNPWACRIIKHRAYISGKAYLPVL